MEKKEKSESIPGKITITRTSRVGKEDSISINLVDDNAVMEFLNISLTLKEFAEALTGIGRTNCDFTVRRLDTVGKERISTSFSTIYPKEHYDNKADLIAWVKKEGAKFPGETSINADSRDFSHPVDGGYRLNYRKLQYVDKRKQEAAKSDFIAAFDDFYNNSLSIFVDDDVIKNASEEEKNNIKAIAFYAFKSGISFACDESN